MPKAQNRIKKLKPTRPTWLRWRIVVPLILLIALVGGYLVSRSYAATGPVIVASEYPASGSYWTIGNWGREFQGATWQAGVTTNFRICFYGRSPNGTSKVNIQPTAFSTLVSVQGTQFTRYCSKEFRMEKGQTKFYPALYVNSGPDIQVQRVIVEQL